MGMSKGVMAAPRNFRDTSGVRFTRRRLTERTEIGGSPECLELDAFADAYYGSGLGGLEQSRRQIDMLNVLCSQMVEATELGFGELAHVAC